MVGGMVIADAVLRVGRVYAMEAGRGMYRAVPA